MPTATASTTAQEIFPQNRLRKSFSINNDDGAIAILLKRGVRAVPTSTDYDKRIVAGSSYALNATADGSANIQDRYAVLAESGTPRYSYEETEDVVR